MQNSKESSSENYAEVWRSRLKFQNLNFGIVYLSEKPFATFQFSNFHIVKMYLYLSGVRRHFLFHSFYSLFLLCARRSKFLSWRYFVAGLVELFTRLPLNLWRNSLWKHPLYWLNKCSWIVKEKSKDKEDVGKWTLHNFSTRYKYIIWQTVILKIYLS